MKEDKKCAVITVPQAFLYEKNGTAADEVLSGWAVQILEVSQKMVRVRTHYGYEGLISPEYLRPVSMVFLRERDHGDWTYVVIRASADVLSEPRVQGKILATLPRGSFLRKNGENRNGYEYVRLFDGRYGYISETAIRLRADSDAFLYDNADGQWMLRQTALSQAAYSEKTAVQQPGPDWEGSLRSSIVRTAESYLGTQYRWGGHTAEGIDCSGLALMSYMMNGILIYRDAQIKEGFPVHRIDPDEKKPGDLLFFPGHVAIYLGGGRYIHSTGYRKDFGVVYGNLLPGQPGYREDLEGKCTAVGSIF